MASARDPLEQAYRDTTYWVDTPAGTFGLRIGQPDPAFDDVVAAAGHASWAFITAWNPGSVRQPDAVNARAQAQLLEQLRLHGLSWWPGRGEGRGDWPAEDSVCVLGLDQATARAWGAAWGQRAIVHGQRGQPAELVDCR